MALCKYQQIFPFIQLPPRSEAQLRGNNNESFSHFRFQNNESRGAFSQLSPRFLAKAKNKATLKINVII